MDPGTIGVFIPILGILLGMLAVLLKHREKMAGVDGKRGSQTIQLLTETLEKEHDRVLQLEGRVQTLERILTGERGALPRQGDRFELPAADDVTGDQELPSRPRMRS